MRKPDDKSLNNLPDTIRNLAGGLTDDEARSRLTRGVLYIFSLQSENLNDYEFNGLVTPIFTQLIYHRFRYDVPVHKFIDTIVSILDVPATVETFKSLKDTQVIQVGGVDDEASFMEKLAFKVTLDFPKDV